jgi:hypothetical protein
MVSAGTQQARQRAYEDAVALRAAIVLDIDPTNAQANIAVDGPDGSAIPAQVVGPTRYYPGDRVMVLFPHPRGALIIGRFAGDWDGWHVVGGDGEPAFSTGWGAAAGTVALGANGPAVPMFTKRGDRVELRGQAERSSGSIQTIWRLPEGYRPENDLLIQAGTTLGAVQVLSIGNTGNVAVPVGSTFGVLDGVSFIARPPHE